MSSDPRYFHPAGARRTLISGPFSAVLLMASSASGGKLSLVEHPLAPRALGSPVHTHSHEDEYSYILAGQIGAQVGGEVILAGPGDVIAKPSGIPHAFWNAGDEPARVLEIIAPGGFEDYFAGLGELLAAGGPPDPAARQALQRRFGLDLDIDSIPQLVTEHRLQTGPPTPTAGTSPREGPQQLHLPGDAHEQFRALEPGAHPANDHMVARRKQGVKTRDVTGGTRRPSAIVRATSPPGNSPSCSRPRSGRRSGRCAKGRPS